MRLMGPRALGVPIYPDPNIGPSDIILDDVAGFEGKDYFPEFIKKVRRSFMHVEGSKTCDARGLGTIAVLSPSLVRVRGC